MQQQATSKRKIGEGNGEGKEEEVARDDRRDGEQEEQDVEARWEKHSHNHSHMHEQQQHQQDTTSQKTVVKFSPPPPQGTFIAWDGFCQPFSQTPPSLLSDSAWRVSVETQRARLASVEPAPSLARGGEEELRGAHRGSRGDSVPQRLQRLQHPSLSLNPPLSGRTLKSGQNPKSGQMRKGRKERQGKEKGFWGHPMVWHLLEAGRGVDVSSSNTDVYAIAFQATIARLQELREREREQPSSSLAGSGLVSRPRFS